MNHWTKSLAAILSCLILLLALSGGARAQSVYTGHLLVGSPHPIANDFTGPTLFGNDACVDPSTEGFHSNCIDLAPSDAGLPFVGFTFTSLPARAVGASGPCVYSPDFAFYDASGTRLAFDEHFVPEGAARLAVSLLTSTCAEIDWTIIFGFE